MSLDAILARQAGVISRDQARTAGLRPEVIDQWVRARRWVPLHPCVYLGADHPRDDEVRLRAALLWAGDGARLSGHAAAWWHGMLAEPPPVVEVTIDRSRRLRSRADIQVRRRVVPEPDRAVHRGLAVTGPALSALDAAIALGAAGGRFLDAALERTVAFADVQAAQARALGTAGSVAADGLLRGAVCRSRSVARDELLALLRRSGASGWTENAEIAGQTVDVAFPVARVAVVVAGWVDPPLADPDDPRRPSLAARGWTLLRFPWRDIVEHPHVVLAEIARQVALGMAVARAC